MTASEDEDESLANFLESEILACLSSSDQEEEEEANTGRSSKKKQRLNEIDNDEECSSSSNQVLWKNQNKVAPKQIETGFFGKVPPELFHHILKYLSSEDLIACSLVCKFLNYAASDECLWRRLYCLRWGLASPTKKLRESAWKQLYIQRDQEDMVDFVRNTPSEFKEYYIQMQAAKRSQAPLLSQVNDDSIILDRTVADQVSMWKASKGLTDDVVVDHACSGDTCSYYQIGDVFLCEKTGRVHVCGDTCRDVIADASNGLLICTISGHCFESMLSPTEPDPDDEQGGVTDDAEPFMGSGRFARAYLLGYNCADEKELQSALRFC